jgi:hypothetical protein
MRPSLPYIWVGTGDFITSSSYFVGITVRKNAKELLRLKKLLGIMSISSLKATIKTADIIDSRLYIAMTSLIH